MKNIKTNKGIRLSQAKGADVTGIYSSKANLAYLLIDSAQNQKDKGITFIQNDDSEQFLLYEEILQKALLRLGGMQKAGIKKGQYVLLVLNNNLDFIITFWACILGGIIPAPLIYPTSTRALNASLKKLEAVWNVLEKPLILSDSYLKESSDELNRIIGISGMEFEDVLTFDISSEGGEADLAEKGSTAYIQFSSGSTNTPKGVILTHGNLLTNVEAIIASANFTSEDRCLGWMPYHHDMGLIGFHLSITALGMAQFNMTPYKFIKRPNQWLELISKYRITITGTPNFGCKLVLSRIKPELLEKLDLSCLKYICNGAEPISVSLAEEFMEKLSVCRLKKSAMYTVYGMAEACLAVSFPIPFEEPLVHSVDRQVLVSKAKVKYVDRKLKNALLLADEGYPVNGTEVRIVDQKGSVVPEGTVGEIQIRGDNVTSGYINNPEANRASFQEGWLKTGDTGFMLDGRLTVVGRIKDIIFVNGQNFYAHDIEDVIEELEGVEPGKVVACGWHDETEGREKVALFSTLHIKDERAKPFYSKILKHVNEIFGIPIDYVVSIPLIPKTTSGKIQRFAMVEAFRNNEYAGKVITAAELKHETMEETSEIVVNRPGLAETICGIWSRVLERPASTIAYDQPFLSMGGTSVKAIQVLGLIEDELALKLTHDLLIKCSTINDMEQYILNIHNNEELKDKNSFLDKTAGNRNSDENDDIAVISMACRFPDASNPEEFWNNILKGKCSIGDIPKERWNIDDYYSSSPEFGKTYCRSGAFIKDVYDFDAGLFNIPDKEAEIMDPQQRIILELVFELLERAGYSRQKVEGRKVALYIGAGTNLYNEYHLRTLNKMDLQNFESFALLSKEQQDSIMEEWKNRLGVTEAHTNILVDNILNMIAARASQEFNFKGPSLVLDTACSSSLVTIHLACEALKRGECEMAIAGGINLLLTPTPYIYFSNAGALSVSSSSKIFDADADGFVPGEGAGLIMLKPLKKAIEDRNDILAVIKASSMNNDGHSIGVMAPNPDGQRDVIESLYCQNDFSPAGIQYVETHGTGTKIGDPSEIRALDNAYRNWNLGKNMIAVGSVKANIGHLLSAAGIASFMKVVMALRDKKMPPQPNVATPNPMIKFPETPFYILKEEKNWKVEEGVARRAAINSFGFGGTNCHIVLEENPVEADLLSEVCDEKPRHILCLSANTEAALEQKINNLSNFLEERKDYSIADVCFTENVLRTTFKNRYCAIADSTADLVEKLKKASLDINKSIALPKVALMFTGQGSQYVGMGRALYEKLPAFRKYVDMCSDAFYPYLDVKITDLLYGGNADEKFLAQTNITQPVVFTMDYSIGSLLLELGVKPLYVLGHSVGEWAAACIAGAVNLEDAARLVAARGRLMSQLKVEGAMAAVFTSASGIEALLKPYEGSLWAAGYNVTHQVVSGKADTMDEFLKELQKKGVGSKRLNVSQAFHTPLMKPMLEAFKKELEVTTFNTPKIPIVSNITAEIYTKLYTPQYWLDHILGAVRFEQSVKYMFDKGINILVEAGPDKILTGMASSLASESNQILASMDRKKDNWDILLNTLGKLFTLGVKIHWEDFEKDFSHKKVLLPSYPFERKTYMPDFGSGASGNLSRRFDNWFHEWSWKSEKLVQISKLNDGAVILFAEDENTIKDFELSLESDKNKLYHVTYGKSFSYDGKQSFLINPLRQEDYFSLLDSIQGEISSIIHMWNYFEKSLEASRLVEQEEVLYKSAYSILLLAKALSNRKLENLRLLLVTNKAFCISGEYEIQNPHQSIAIVLGQALDTEVKGLFTSVLDIDNEDYISGTEAAATIVDELGKKPNAEAIVAVRKKERFVRELEKAPISKLIEDKIYLNDNETYLITGGTGLIGGSIAEAFAKRAQVNLVLTGRGELPPGEEWNENSAEAAAAKISLIRSLESKGAKVAYFAVDVSDSTQMSEMVKQVNEEFGPIHGVVHAAGIMDSSAYKLLDKDLETFKNVLAAKVNGTIVTDCVTNKEPLKFFVLMSSVSASKKKWSAGITDYAAANYFLDCYSSYRSKSNSPGKSLAINYSLWEAKGKGIISGEASELAVKAQGLRPLPAEGAVEAFMQALNYKNQNVIHIMDLMEAKEEIKPLRKETKAAYEESRMKVSGKTANEIRSIVYGTIAEELNADADNIDEGMNFLEMGLSSLDVTKIVARISKALGAELYPTLIFEYQTPEAFTNYIEKTYAVSEGEIAAVAEENLLYAADKNKEDIQDIAIIGIGLRIPGADTLEEYWDILKNGKCIIKEVPKDRWSAEENYSDDKKLLHTTYTNKGGFIDKPYDFDPLLFGMSPNEAEATDPQQRIFLQIAWEALQQAGYGGKYKSNKIGVFVGCEQNSYMEHFTGYRTYMLLKNKLEQSEAYKGMKPKERRELMTNILQVLNPGQLVADAVAGSGLNEIAARVSHCLNLSGPSLIVNSACSSSLVALHMACESLRTGQAEMALAGGVNLNMSATPFVSLSRVTALSPSGNCYPFDKRADGMVLSEGASAVLLKPLKYALEDNDNIFAVIKGSAINNDGHSQGITAPRPQGQAEAIRNAYITSGINPETVSYIETHGTGTPLGDPIEIEGMTQAMRSFTSKKNFCGVGSVKSSLGHMLSAAGLISLIKVVLALNNKTIPHTINFEEPNTNIDFSNSPFYVVGKEPREWKAEGSPLRAGVNAFGFGGTNAHVILEEAPLITNTGTESEEERQHNVIFLTGRNEKIVQAIAGNLIAHMKKKPELDLSSICFTMNNSQKELTFKTAIVTDSKEHLLDMLLKLEKGEESSELIKGRSNPNRVTPVSLVMDCSFELDKKDCDKIAKRFSGFAEAYNKCMQIFEKEGSGGPDSQLAKTVESFALQYAFGALLCDFGIKLKSIICEDNAILAGGALAGIITIKQAARFLINKAGYKNNELDESTGYELNCPVVTPLGIADKTNIFDLVSSIRGEARGKLSLDSCKEIINKDEAIVYLGSSKTKGNEFEKMKFNNLQWIEMSMSQNCAAAILAVMAKLYTTGVSYNPSKLSWHKARRVPLPTYPFENSEYKVSFKDESLEADNNEYSEEKTNNFASTNELVDFKEASARLALKKLNTQEAISGEAKACSIEGLRRDLSKI
ncbi:erythronolide synthase, modules 5 and 6 [Ruminiclostridium hungatei]|uniref:Erythronolide synthase, modules 5 and 6 n=1 Tax=Ruminiclostridium hungatei TaxID=48256 RepID=A0A1V4SJ95_RUMHU|nr:type I polyketide synthase [Ruminiclostridium hungatei]OPX43969.1 erythronolide synthase, modules 5 and 6 [Ruminiclostridium hungatei]